MKKIGTDEKRIAALEVLLTFSVFAVLCAIFAWVLLSNGAVAWFSSNREVKGSGMSVASNVQTIEFGDTITLVRHTGTASLTVTYRQDTEGNYYEYASGAYVLEDGNKIPLRITGLLPSEYMDITVTFKSTNIASYNYGLRLEGFDDTLGKFSVTSGEVTQSHSILGVYTISIISSGAVVADSTKWIATYNSTGDDTIVDPLEIATGSGTQNTEISVTFRLTVDLAQYNNLAGTTPNLLSEKEFSVGKLLVYVTGYTE